jgi:hypothetical protein
MTPSEIEWHIRNARRNTVVVVIILALPVVCACIAVARAMGWV